MLREPVLRVLLLQLQHHPVPRHLQQSQAHAQVEQHTAVAQTSCPAVEPPSGNMRCAKLINISGLHGLAGTLVGFCCLW